MTRLYVDAEELQLKNLSRYGNVLHMKATRTKEQKEAAFEGTLKGYRTSRDARQWQAVMRISKLEDKAAPMVGELCREGKPVFYAYPAGGRYFESASKQEVVSYIIRNGWVS